MQVQYSWKKFWYNLSLNHIFDLSYSRSVYFQIKVCFAFLNPTSASVVGHWWKVLINSQYYGILKMSFMRSNTTYKWPVYYVVACTSPITIQSVEQNYYNCESSLNQSILTVSTWMKSRWPFWDVFLLVFRVQGEGVQWRQITDVDEGRATKVNEGNKVRHFLSLLSLETQGFHSGERARLSASSATVTCFWLGRSRIRFTL